MRRALSRALAGVAAAAALAAGTGHASGAAARSLAGDWTWTLEGKCVDSSRNRQACDEMLAMGLHVYGLKATNLEYRGSDRLTVDAHARYTERGSAIFSATSPGGSVLKVCNPILMERGLFRKTCRVSWSGYGHIEEGGTFQLDFYSDDGRLTFPNKKITYYQTYHGVGDTLIPAVPGVYSTRRYLSLVGYASYIAGITIRLTVTHVAR